MAKEVDVVVPFTTNDAFERVNENKAFGIPVRFHRTQAIPSLKELWAKPPPGERAKIESVAHYADLFADHNTLTFFDHKMPDFVSLVH